MPIFLKIWIKELSGLVAWKTFCFLKGETLTDFYWLSVCKHSYVFFSSIGVELLQKLDWMDTHHPKMSVTFLGQIGTDAYNIIRHKFLVHYPFATDRPQVFNIFVNLFSLFIQNGTRQEKNSCPGTGQTTRVEPRTLQSSRTKTNLGVNIQTGYLINIINVQSEHKLFLQISQKYLWIVNFSHLLHLFFPLRWLCKYLHNSPLKQMFFSKYLKLLGCLFLQLILKQITFSTC